MATDRVESEEVAKDWELSYYVRATREQAETIYDAIQTILCTCEFKGEEAHCRVPVSGMHLYHVDEVTGERTSATLRENT